ncbi:MAG: RidA family protein [Actinomycetota bacterium]
MREEIQPTEVMVPTRPYVPVVATEDLVFVSGQVPVDGDGALAAEDLDGQVRAVIRNVEVCLRAAGSGLGDVVRVGAYLTSRDSFARFNELYAEGFGGAKPVRTTIVCGLMDDRFLVEMDAIAVRPRTGAGSA